MKKTVGVAIIMSVLLASSASALKIEDISKSSYWFLSVDLTETGGDFDGSIYLYSSDSRIIVPEIGLGGGIGFGVGGVGRSGLGGDAFMRFGLQSTENYGSGWITMGGNFILAPAVLRIGEGSRLYLKAGANWTVIWVDESEVFDYGMGFDPNQEPKTANYSGFGIDVLCGIEIFRSKIDSPRSLRLEGGYRLISFGSVNAIEIEDGLSGNTILFGLSYNFWF